MRSKTALRIFEETPYEVKEEVRRNTNLKIETMHEVFKKMKSKKIQLDSEFWLMPDPYKGLILQREVEKSRKKIDKETILKYMSEEEIFESILGFLPVEHEYICSPLREDDPEAVYTTTVREIYIFLVI